MTVLCFVLGFLLAGSVQTVSGLKRSGTSGGNRIGGIAQQAGAPIETVLKQQKQIEELLKEKTKLENSLALGEGPQKALNDELQKMKLTAGLSEVTGNGIILTLQDSKTGPPSNRQFEAEDYNIHDVTIQRAINELNASGAEAISINGQRLLSRTAIRCVGPTAQVNGVPMTSPYHIKVIGDPETLAGGLTFPGGFVQWLNSYDPEMVKIEKIVKKDLVVPAYSGSTEFRYAKPTAPASQTVKKSPVSQTTDKDTQ